MGVEMGVVVCGLRMEMMGKVFEDTRADASCRMLQQTLSYLDNFARFTRKENVEAVERLLSSATQLSKFERAQLGTSPLLPSASRPFSIDRPYFQRPRT